MKYLFSKLALAAALGLSGSYSFAMDNMDMTATTDKKQQTQKAYGKGTVVSTDVGKGTVKLKHEPMPELGWPMMTMQFKVEDQATLKNLNKGERVEFVLKAVGDDYVITHIKHLPTNAGQGSR